MSKISSGLRYAIFACGAAISHPEVGTAQSTRDEPALRISVDGASTPPQVVTYADLTELRNVTFETSTIWSEARQSFTGVPLETLLLATLPYEMLVPGAVVRVIALNEYFADIPLASLGADVPILAFHIDGQPFPIRNKGPFWVVYPYDSDPQYMTGEIYSRSVWQVEELVLLMP